MFTLNYDFTAHKNLLNEADELHATVANLEGTNAPENVLDEAMDRADEKDSEVARATRTAHDELEYVVTSLENLAENLKDRLWDFDDSTRLDALESALANLPSELFEVLRKTALYKEID